MQLVAAIEIGTAFSGYAFSSREDFKNDPLQITSPEWSKSPIAHKVPTCVLFDKNKSFLAFGYEAGKIFKELSENGIHQEHYFFERFKMQLYNKSDKKKRKVQNDFKAKLLNQS